jgi:hypothetical protein
MPTPSARVLFFLLVAGLGQLLPAQTPGAGTPGQADTVVLSFVATGDTRLDRDNKPNNPLHVMMPGAGAKVDPTKKDLPLTQAFPESFFTDLGRTRPATDTYPYWFNAVQMRQTLTDVANLSPRPDYFFFTGDMVMGFAKDATTLSDELQDFAKAIEKTPNKPWPDQTKLVVLPGNHGMTWKHYEDGKMKTGLQPGNEAPLLDWLKSKHYNQESGNGPGANTTWQDEQKASPALKLMTDQSHLTYSFDVPGKGIHFIMLNTDTDTQLGEDENGEGYFPLGWVEKDLKDANERKDINHIFVLAHRPVKPASVIPKDKVKPSDTVNPVLSEPLRKILAKNNKVRAYISSHAHLWDVVSLADQDKTTSPNARPVQLISGNGGADLDGGSTYGFVLVKVWNSGKVTYNPYSRPAPTPYYGWPTEPAHPTADTEILK